MHYTCLCCSGWAWSHRLLLHSKSSPQSTAIRAALQASHSSENRHFYWSAEKWACCSEVVQMPHHILAKPPQPSAYSMAPCHTSNCASNFLKMTAREMWQYFSWDAACWAKIQSTALRRIRNQTPSHQNQPWSTHSRSHMVMHLEMCVSIGYPEMISSCSRWHRSSPFLSPNQPLVTNPAKISLLL